MTVLPHIQPPLGLISDVEFRRAMGRFLTGVSVVTVRNAGVDFGATVSAFSSVSNEPPTALVCLNQASDTSAAVVEAGSFAVNILAERQVDLAARFSTKGSDKFAGVSVHPTRLGHPGLTGAHCLLDCVVTESLRSGTHTVFIAAVHAASFGHDGAPLGYHSGKLGRFTEHGRPEVGIGDLRWWRTRVGVQETPGDMWF